MYGQGKIDDDWQKAKRDKYLAPFYRGRAHLGQFVFLDGAGTTAQFLQQNVGIDTIVRTMGGTVGVEEKIVRWPNKVYDAYFIETHSCTRADHESNGWAYKSGADVLLYCFEQADETLIAHMIDWQQFHPWFWDHFESFRQVSGPGTNRSLGRLVKIQEVMDSDVGMTLYNIDQLGEFK